ncbi:MAG TPA: metallophosphoesterase [Bacteroidetes bacterium]|nr:metallophosphoesterase [Bacteroidota bacterium]
MKLIASPLVLTFFILLATSCANYKYNILDEAKGWENTHPDPSLKLEHTIYLVGDAGNADLGETPLVLKYLKKTLAKETENSSIIFLGDNIYPDGLVDRDDKRRELAEYRLNAQLDILENYKGRPIFLPGNHDWGSGLKGLKRQQKYVNKYLNKQQGITDKDDDNWRDYFLPENGCPGPEVIEISKKLVILVVDTEWWLEDWNKQPKINDQCLSKSREMFEYFFLNAVKKYRSRNIVIATHHPPFTNGPHGGNYTAKQHIFPLTDIADELYIPLPGIGSIAALVRGSVGTKQDQVHQLNKDLMKGMLHSANTFGSFIFVSGHEHNLQYLENGQQKFVVSGSGSKTSPSRIGKGARFAYGTMGYSTLDFYENGEAWVQFWQPNEEGTDAKVVYRQKVKGKLDIIEENIPASFPEFEKNLDSVEVYAVQNKVPKAGPLHKFFLGDHYRDVYLQKYKFPVLDLTKFDGGVVPVKRGGGSQTNSLRLENLRTGRQFAMRGLTKDASRILPYPLNKMTAAVFILEDNFLSSHPFAPTVMPPMADAINIYHTTPGFYYVPKQPALGVNNDIFGGGVYLVEERPAGDYSGAEVFGGSEKIISTFDLSEKITKNNDHKIDQPWALRSRLFDILLGDFDRHDDQWRWARFEENGKKIYRPIPRDRDQPFGKYDGLISRLANFVDPFARQLRVYGPEIEDIKHLTWSSLSFDNPFLNELEWADWEKEAKFIQKNLTDEVIDKAFEVWPEKAKELTAGHIKSSLKKRRDDLLKYARQFYEVLSKEVDVYGTDENELFEIERLDDEHTKVTVWEISEKKGKKKEQVYERTFERSVTKEIHLFGIGDEDQFRVSGDVKKGIKIRCIGGLGNDKFIDESKVGGLGKKTFFYDDLRKNDLSLGTEAKDKRSHFREHNLYDRRSLDHNYSFLVPLPVIGANPDDGILLGFAGALTTYKFRKIPYSTFHAFYSSLAFETNGINLEYTGDYLEVFGKWDFYLTGIVHTPSFAFNYFGDGNDSPKGDNDNNFNRVRQSKVHFRPALKKRVAGEAGFFRIGPVFDLTDIEASEGRFITDQFDLNSDIFQRKYYGGLEIGFEYSSLDNIFSPKRGLRFTSHINWLTNLRDQQGEYRSLNAELSLFQPINRKETVIFATRIGFGTNLGNEFEFYQQQRIGGGFTANLRGYRSDRFFGKTAYWQNFDLRSKLFSSYNRTLPFSLGVFASFDYGKVWVEDVESDTWHFDYGGGLYIAPVDLLTMSFGLYQPREDAEGSARFIFRMGMGF